MNYARGRLISLVLAASAPLILAATCWKPALSSDSTPPRIYILKWEMTPLGAQGAQTTIPNGGQFTVLSGWLGQGGATNKADIKVYADDTEGVRELDVSGSATGPCETDQDSNGVFYTSPGPLTVSFPKQTITASPGAVQPSMVVHLDDIIRRGACGKRQYANMLNSQEFFLDSGTWTINVHAENCCGGQTNGAFKITVQ